MEITLKQLCRALRDMSDWHMINLGHDDRVSELCVIIGIRAGLTEKQLINLKYASEIHDIGRVGVDNYILAKASKLTESQYAAVKFHPIYGYNVVKNIVDMELAEGILYHHEDYNGAGYPLGLKGENIPIIARIIRIADYWDSIRHDRPYRKAMTRDQAFQVMREDREKFDPRLYKIFLEVKNLVNRD